jgi:hypothetical protein
MMYPEPEKGGRGKNEAAKKTVVSTGLSVERLKQARSILHHSRSLAEAVLKGITPLAQAVMSATTSLNDAVEVVRQYEQQAATTPRRIYRKRSGSRRSRLQLAPLGTSHGDKGRGDRGRDTLGG